MDSATLNQIKELGVPAFAVIMMLVTAMFMIRQSSQAQARYQEATEESKAQVDRVIEQQQARYDELQKSFTQQLIQDQIAAKQRETELLKQLTQTNQRVVELQLDLGKLRGELTQSQRMVDQLTQERNQKATDYESEAKARVALEKRVNTLESDLGKSKQERKELSAKYEALIKEHDLLVAERNKRLQTQNIPKVESS